MGIPRMFRLPFLSCRHRDTPDLAQEPMFIAHRDFGLLQPSAPVSSCPTKTRSLSALCRSSQSLDVAKSPSVEADGRRRTCPPAPPASPLVSCIKSLEVEEKAPRKKKKEKKSDHRRKKKISKGNEAMEVANVMPKTTSSGDSHCFFSSDEEKQFDENDAALFSSKSFSSDSSSESYRLRSALRGKARPRRKGRSCRREEDTETRFLDMPTRGKKVDQSVAVVKRSNDPYADFRISMVEMIIEKQIFGANELEKLLDCFLALNAPYHHRVIVDVFEEICEALFYNWS